MNGVFLGPLRARATRTVAAVRRRGWRDLIRPASPHRPAVLGELVIVAFLVYVYSLFRAQTELRVHRAVGNAWALLGFETRIHIDWEHWANNWLTGHHDLALLLSYYYQFTHVTVTLSVLVLCYLRVPTLYRPLRTALVLTNVIALAVYWVYPLAPPRLLAGGGYVDSVARAGFGAEHGGSMMADQYGAMPSLHLAWAIWVAVACCCLTTRWWLRGLAISYTVVMAVTVIGTGNHFVLDVVAGVVDAFVGVTVARSWVAYQDRSPVADDDLLANA